ncbi:MAG: thrombospondin type 3 repeat-containing protein [Saprospiraceae bacterium]|nr:thrombospondin type 3 repeat-containing protein [Saprospiraceae bacterium]
MNNKYLIQLVILMLTLSVSTSSCKWDKKENASVEEKILINGNKAPLFNIDITEVPTVDDNGNYIQIEEGEPVSLTYEGIEKDAISWLVDDMVIGEGTNIQYPFSSPGIHEVKATLSNGDERIVFVMVSERVINEAITEVTQPVTENNQPTEVDQTKPVVSKPTPSPSSDPKPRKIDKDNDDVPDEIDHCPEQWGLKNFNGCPDSDNDGIPDKIDKCPNIFGPKLKNGCPEDDKKIITPTPIADRDTDGDEIPDKRDKCPNQKGLSQFDGCPDSDGDGIPDKDDKCPNERGVKEHSGCLPPPPVVFVPKTTSTICGLASQAALDDEKGTSSGGSMTIKPSQDLILHEAKLVASGHGKIDISIEGGDIKKEVTITKNVNPGNNTIRMNDLKNTVLRAGKSYTLIYQTQGDVQVTQIKNAYASGCADSRVTLSGKNIFYDIIYKY